MPTDTSEKGLEALIADSLVDQANYERGRPEDYDRDHAVDLVKLLAFLKATQSEIVEKLALDEDGAGQQQFLGTEQENSARFEREGGATWASGGGLSGTARTGSAARHAAQRAELRQSGCNGLTRCGVELLVSRSRSVSRS
jgi:hypothetical protein